MEPTCPICHQSIQVTDFYCPNCGKKLHDPPLSTSPLIEILYYIGSVCLPPLGLFWGIKYLRQEGEAAKRIGTLSIALTIISLIITVMWTINFMKQITTQVNTQLNNFQTEGL